MEEIDFKKLKNFKNLKIKKQHLFVMN